MANESSERTWRADVLKRRIEEMIDKLRGQGVPFPIAQLEAYDWAERETRGGQDA